MPDNWFLFDDGQYNPFYNMALDEALLLKGISKQINHPLLRFYGWNQRSLSIGRYQNMDRDINTAQAAKDHVPIVRRPTGGRAVLHDNELTYAVIIPKEHPLSLKNLHETFSYISQPIYQGLVKAGFDVQFETTALGNHTYHKQSACFSSTTQYEITCQGHKIVGSAQYRHQGAILQQGSIILQATYDSRAYINNQDSPQTGLWNLTGIKTSLETIKTHIIQSFISLYTIQFIPSNADSLLADEALMAIKNK